ncbi:hypothetical protein SHAL103562_16945 [Shewanella algae]
MLPKAIINVNQKGKRLLSFGRRDDVNLTNPETFPIR